MNRLRAVSGRARLAGERGEHEAARRTRGLVTWMTCIGDGEEHAVDDGELSGGTDACSGVTACCGRVVTERRASLFTPPGTRCADCQAHVDELRHPHLAGSRPGRGHRSRCASWPSRSRVRDGLRRVAAGLGGLCNRCARSPGGGPVDSCSPLIDLGGERGAVTTGARSHPRRGGVGEGRRERRDGWPGHVKGVRPGEGS
jgi:hypothetical protein